MSLVIFRYHNLKSSSILSCRIKPGMPFLSAALNIVLVMGLR